MSQTQARFVVGIDLGTTHTVVAFVDTARAAQRKEAESGGKGTQGVAASRPRTDSTRPDIQVLALPQLVAPGEVADRPLLPSFRYHPAEGELPADSVSAPFAAPTEGSLVALPRGIVGTLAQALGRRVPGRLVSSAKSWLCHAAVDREAPILPWGASEEIPKISPVDASASYLAHVRAAWNQTHPEHPLESQEVVLTVPASFDEAARALTLQAAREAGLAAVRLLEEPQAAFYDWLDRHRETLEDDLASVKLALVVDVGGGTTDLTLIQAELRESGPRLTRIAVGDHLMLGGDNMDLALARHAEQALGERAPGQRLSAARFSQLVEQCRGAKERLLAPDAPETVSVSVLGSGAKLVGGTQSTPLSRARVHELVLDGFLPEVGLDAVPRSRTTALVELGLPYVADPAITKHIAQFLTRHRSIVAESLDVPPDASPARLLPDALLLNGGVFRGSVLAQRLQQVLAGFRGAPLALLDNQDPELAVARGAVAYGLARRGLGLRIGGGSPRSYYLDVENAEGQRTGVCVLPRGSEEGEEVVLQGRTFALRVGQPVRFRLWTSTSERTHRAGELVTLDDAFHELPEVAAVLESQNGGGREVDVALHAGLTEVGTLEMSCVAVKDPTRRYKLAFELRGQRAREGTAAATRVTQLHPRFEEATALIRAFYGKPDKALEGRKIKTLRGDLEKILGAREGWDTALLRELFDALLAGAKRRRRSADHERLWFHLAGYCLRPGFGYPLDPFRIEQMWPLYAQGLQYTPDAQVWSQWWIMWRRIAGGLDAAQQQQILDDLAYYLEPQGRRPKPRPKGPKAQGLEEMVRLAGALERLSADRKVEVGQWLLAQHASKALSGSSMWWALGRLGARATWYGSVHTVVPPDVAASWLGRALEQNLTREEQAAFAVAQLARFTHDRSRDLDPELRERAAAALEKTTGNEAWVALVREGGELGEIEQKRVFGESLPAGLRLMG